MMSNWNFSEIRNFGANEGMNWCFNKSADAPWQNNCNESDKTHQKVPSNAR